MKIYPMKVADGRYLNMSLVRGNNLEFSNYGNLCFYQIALDQAVGFSLKVSADVIQPTVNTHVATLSRHFNGGQEVAIVPDAPVTVVGLLYDARNPNYNGPKLDFTLVLRVTIQHPRVDGVADVHNGDVCHTERHIEHFRTILASGKLSDCDVISTNGIRYKCHKLILSLKSDVIQAFFEFSGMAKAESNELKIDYHNTIAEMILAYMYTGHMGPVSTDSVLELFRVSHLYNVEGLKSYVAEKIMLNAENLVEVANVLELLVYAEQFDLDTFKQYCMQFVRSNIIDVKKTPAWELFQSANASLAQQL